MVKKVVVHCSVVLDSAVFDMYAKGVSFKEARYFDRMNERTVVNWNTMVSGCTKHGLSKEAFALYGNCRGKECT